MLDYMPDDEVRPAKRNATYQDVLDAPEHVKAEILDGDLFLSPLPRPRHSFSMLGLGTIINNSFGRKRSDPGGWLILVEPEVHLGPDVIGPDLAGWKLSNKPKRLATAAWIEKAP